MKSIFLTYTFLYFIENMQNMEEDYYKILGVNYDATDEDIKKVYKKLAIMYHPDKVSADKKEESTKMFQKISEANEVLSNKEKRIEYDNNFFFPEFQSIKNDDTPFTLNLTLKDVYLGCVKKIKITKKAIIDKSTKEVIKKDLNRTWRRCTKCKGNGIITETMRHGNMLFQTQKRCDICQGQRVILFTNYDISNVIEILDINIPKGIKNGEQHRFANQGDSLPGSLPGDMVITLNIENRYEGFSRLDNSNKLQYKQRILLSEALCGGSFKIKTIDERILYVNFTDPIKFGDTKTIKCEGINGDDLIINFDIVFPELNDLQKAEILKILPTITIEKNEDDVAYKL